MADLPPPYAAPPAPDYYPISGPATEVLPSYNDSGEPQMFVPTRGIDDKVPNHFRIGQNYAPCFVKPSDSQAHLVLIGAFHRLREEVQTQMGEYDIPLEPHEQWAIFLQRAVYRFECWAVRMIGVEDEDEELREPGILSPNEVPPLDVMMVWHTYILNPRSYYEDCIRRFLGLLRFGSFPISQLAATIDQESLLPHPPTPGRRDAFTAFTGQPFDPPMTTVTTDSVTVFCPSCSYPNSLPWVTVTGEGYAQRGFKANCTKHECEMHFTHESLGVRKFFEDMEKCVVDPDHRYLANTLVDYNTGIPDTESATSLSCLLLHSKQVSQRPLRPEEAGFTFGWDFNNIVDICRSGLLKSRNKPYIDTPRPIGLVLAAYRNPGPCSIDLASAILRQMSFIDKMVQLGWTESQRFEEDHDTLTRSVVRYHHFIDLMTTSKGKFMVPTLDIDLAWHTHQLLCTSYRKLKDVIGMIPDHDDKVGQAAVATAYDDTAAAWKNRYGVPYSVCGCLQQSKTTMPPQTSAVRSIFSPKGKGKAQHGPLENARQDLISGEDRAASETHPSDHNAVAIINPGDINATQAQLRRREMDTRKRELAKAVAKGRADQWGELQAKRMNEHEHSFLCPVQYGTKAPFGPSGRGDCSAFSGKGVEGDFGVGDCIKAGGFSSLCGASFENPRTGLNDSVAYGVLMSGDRRQLQKDLGLTVARDTWNPWGSGVGGGGTY